MAKVLFHPGCESKQCFQQVQLHCRRMRVVAQYRTGIKPRRVPPILMARMTTQFNLGVLPDYPTPTIMSTNQYHIAPGPSDNPVAYPYQAPPLSHAMATWLEEPRKAAPYNHIASVPLSPSSGYVPAGHYSTSNTGATHGADTPSGPRAASWVNKYVFVSCVAPHQPQLTAAGHRGSNRTFQPSPLGGQAASMCYCWANL